MRQNINNFLPPLSRNDLIALSQGAIPISVKQMSKERQRRFRGKHPDSWRQTASRIGFSATIRLYADKPNDAELIEILERQRQEGESDRDLLLRIMRQSLNFG